ncbi:hypothetical protein [Bryobacter aggregatus]|uniref:hypothetical protein n=1 Tax=Bryobacter aggregatus TaxID=360054 RepID=UPI0004E0F120|nr:hypothetical protein [Bryobacter aggregatus]
MPITTMPIQRASKTWSLPPLILHPFAEAAGPDKLVESSRASLMLQGLLPSGEISRDELDRRLIDGRFCEIRMLFYVGKDLLRWIEQCMELVERDEDLKRVGFCYQSFAAILTEDPPRNIREKLKNWGVADHKSIFTRALGLNAIFNEVPQRHGVTDEFIRHYYRYADQLFACRQLLWSFGEIKANQFDFDLYASGEYSRMLEREWSADFSDGFES